MVSVSTLKYTVGSSSPPQSSVGDSGAHAVRMSFTQKSCRNPNVGLTSARGTPGVGVGTAPSGSAAASSA